MIYKIPVSQLKKIANPFKQIAFENTQFPLEMAQIEFAIDNNNIFEDEHESTLQNHTRRIAYLVSNYQEQVIKINIEKNTSGWIIEEGSEYLAATIYKKVKHILADIQGSEKSIKTIFGDVEIVNHIKPSTKLEIIDWGNKPMNEWTNIQYIISSLENVGSQKSNLKEILELVDDSVWKDKDNTMKIIESIKGGLMFLPQRILDSEYLLDAIKDNYVAFGAMWNFYYKDIYNQDTLISQKIKTEVFNDINMCSNLLTYSYKVGFLSAKA